jgi:DNA polymerase-3 subunit epsilon
MAIRNQSGRSEAVKLAQTYLGHHPLYLDTETTGVDSHSEIVEICLIDYDGQLLYSSLIKPTRPIPVSASRIHGITNAMVAESPRWISVWPDIKALLSDRYVGIYNADFDLRLMQQSHVLYRMPWHSGNDFKPFCIMKLYAQYRGVWDFNRRSYRWISLENAGAQLKIPIPNSHRASDDTLLARAVLHAIAASR